jgi:hypothetical protein
VYTHHALESQIFSLALCKAAQEELQDLCRKAANGEFPLMKHPQHLSYYIKGFHLCFRLLMSWNFPKTNPTSFRFMLKELPK